MVKIRDQKNSLSSDRLLTEIEVAERLGWSRKTLQRRRWLKQEPAWVKIGASVRYSEHAIDHFIENGRQEPVAA